MKTEPTRHRLRAWLPRQYGSYAMVIVPFLGGILLANHANQLGWEQLWLGLTWGSAFLFFSTATGWLKASNSKRAGWLPPLLTYGILCTGTCLVSLYLIGWRILIWCAGLAVLAGIGLVETLAHRERSLAAGLASVAAACAGLLLARYPDPMLLWDDPARPNALGMAALLFGYFGGTVFYVKTLVRERGKPAWRIAAIVWHLAALLAAGGVGWWGWLGFFTVAALRAWLVPWRCPTIPIKYVGLGEVGLSLVALTLIGLTA